jgi:hypothetical protein
VAGALVVTNLADAGSGSLRDTLAKATGGSTIAFDPSLAGKTIALSTGALFVNASPITIQGPCPTLTITWTGSAPGQHMIVIGGSVQALLANLTLTSTNASALGAAASSNVTLNSVAIVNSSAANCAAIDAGNAPARLTVTRSTIAHNAASGDGIVCTAGQFNVLQTSFSSNATQGYGTIYNSNGTSDVTSSEFDSNTSANGGAIAATSGLAGAMNSTFYANTASASGGAIYIASGAMGQFDYITAAGNTSTSAQIAIASGGTLMLHSSLATNRGGSTPADTAGAFASLGYNYITAPGTATGFTTTDILGRPQSLYPFGAYGGPTNSVPPQSPSGVIDAADPRSGECPNADQRGVKRPQASACDIGAIEYQPANPP